ncbi:redoxin family protein [Methanolobus sp. ZRKC3]|uniref:TlpA family protein disulfide reductase n=1 Tax=Methanolobus sp. ZRKC3 TaxID=3125786 RepID=UPI00324DD783
MNKQINSILLCFMIIISISVISGCAETDTVDSEPAGDWRDIELTDVRTGEVFKISDFEGKTVLIESFAVWCPTCLKQQQETKILSDMEDENVIHIGLDTDPNEDEEIVRNHAQSNGFDWYYAVSPVEFTQSLIDQFGVGVVNAPSAPVILICEDQSTRLLRNGVKPAEELQEEIEKGCA